KEEPIAEIEEEEIPMEELPELELELRDEEATTEDELELQELPIELDEVVPIEPVGTNVSALVSDDENFSVEIEQGEDELSEDEIVKKVEELGPFDPRRDLSRYTWPSVELLKPHGGQGPQINKE